MDGVGTCAWALRGSARVHSGRVAAECGAASSGRGQWAAVATSGVEWTALRWSASIDGRRGVRLSADASGCSRRFWIVSTVRDCRCETKRPKRLVDENENSSSITLAVKMKKKGVAAR